MIETTITIEAPIVAVREVFFNFMQYPTWNPFIIKLQGDTQVKGQIYVSLVLPQASSPENFDPIVLVHNQNEFRWIGTLGCSCCFSGQHYFIMRQLGANRTEFIQGEDFGGCLRPIFSCFMETKTRRAFEIMNLALKQRVQGLAAQSSHKLTK